MKKKTLWLYLFLVPIFAKAQELDWKFRREGHARWYPAGENISIFEDLEASHLIPDPFAATNLDKVQWVEQEDWIYEARFDLDHPQSGYLLSIPYLDTYADVYLNNQLILHSNNAYIGHEIDVSSYLRERNILQIRFRSAVEAEKRKAKKLPFTYPADSDSHPQRTSVFSRKPPYHFGWDFAPRLVGCSAGKISLRPCPIARITDLHLVSDTSGVIRITAMIFSKTDGERKIRISESHGKFEEKEQLLTLKKGENIFSTQVRVPQPELWWPAGMGSQPLYEVKLDLPGDGISNEKKAVTAFRTLELVREKDSIGETFYFEVNGIPVFAKGANYIQTERSIREADIQDMMTAGMNTIRIWGGAWYGDDTLYTLCDKYGMLVWQDFMFACSMYPGDNAFLENVAKEAAYQVRRIRNHPSLALWCGNNEIEVGWKNWGWQQRYRYSAKEQERMWSDYKRLFHGLLPNIVKELDPKTAYLPSSPVSNWGKPEDLTIGDNHFWGVYHGDMPFTAYDSIVPRFASEYGFQSIPELWTLEQVSGKRQLTFDDPAFLIKQKCYKGNGLLHKYISWYHHPATDVDDFSHKTQLLQAEAMRTAIESHRRNQPYCMGSLLWQYNDVWPGLSWSLVDHFGNKKAAWFAVSEAFNTSLSIQATNESWDLYCLAPQPANTEIVVWMTDMHGKVLREERFPVSCSAGVAMITRIDRKTWLARNDPAELVFRVLMKNGEKMISDRIVLPNAPKDMALSEAPINIRAEESGKDHTWLILESDVVVKNLRISMKDEPGKVFSANFIDLWPGEPRRIKVAKANVQPADIITKSLH